MPPTLIFIILHFVTSKLVIDTCLANDYFLESAEDKLMGFKVSFITFYDDMKIIFFLLETFANYLSLLEKLAIYECLLTCLRAHIFSAYS